jgi:glycogen phosphorylase
MNYQKKAPNPIHTLLPTGVEGSDVLAELALDMRWSWNHEAVELWRRLDPVLWDLTHTHRGTSVPVV